LTVINIAYRKIGCYNSKRILIYSEKADVQGRRRAGAWRRTLPLGPFKKGGATGVEVPFHSSMIR